MSQIMEKTLASLPKLLTQSFIGGKTAPSSNRQTPAQDVVLFMKLIHKARSKSHEAAIISSELSNIQQKLKQSDLIGSVGVVRNCFTKIIFCHILGYDVSFAAIYAVNLAQQGQGYDKRLGYLLSCLLLHPKHDMVMLMMTTLLRDLKSSNMSNNCTALLVAGELVGEESLPSILPEVIKKLAHSHELVREKALHCLHSFYKCAPSLLQPYLGQLSKFLSSRDPGELSAVTSFYLLLCQEHPGKFVNLGPSFLHILDQINLRGFGANYYYHMVPLPWMQVCLLKILGCLGSVDPQLSKAATPLLQTLIEKTKVTEPISLAILVESVSTATQINADDELLNLCSRCIGKLLSSDASVSMKYQGLGLLISLSRVKPSFAAQHQIAVVECLLDVDPVIQIRTTHLLHAMANRANLKAVCTRLFEQINKTTDKLFFNETLMMISDLTERLTVDIDLYLETYLKILEQKINSELRDIFIELVLSKMESFSTNSDTVTSDSLNRLTTSLFHVLSKPDESSQSIILLSLQLFGLLAPIIKDSLSSSLFLIMAENILFKEEPRQNKITKIIPSANCYTENDDSHREDLIHTECLVTLSKLVLSGCLQVDCVKDWLKKHDHKKLFKNSSFNICFDELEELLQVPEDLPMRSQVMFSHSRAGLDLSLSFLDNLVVQDLLRGGGVLKPRYVKQSEQVISSIAITPALDSDSSTLNKQLSSEDGSGNVKSPTSSKMSSSVSKTKSKWRDNDDDEEDNENFLIVNTEREDDDNRRKHEKIAHELFAGLVPNDIPLSNQWNSHDTQNPNKPKKYQNIWDDVDEVQAVKDGLGFSSLGLHPFGIYKKTPKPTSLWQDEDIENDNFSLRMDDISPLGFISCTSEKSPNKPIARDIFYGGEKIGEQDKLLNSSLHKSFPGALLESGDQSRRPAASIYSESFTDLSLAEQFNSGITSSGNMSVSTIDALTDSDPEEPSV